MKRVALYIRVSTEEQRIHGLSIETQEKALKEYANKNNMYIVDFYIDAGLTARKSIDKRTELQRMLKDIQNKKIDIVLFTKLDRWFRNISDYYKIQEVLEKNNVSWKAIYEDYDTMTANGRLHVNIMLSIAQDEADRTSERIKAVFKNKREKKECTFWKAPLGYKVENSKLLINEETKDIAIDIFNSYDINRSVNGCCRMAKERYGHTVYEYTVRRMFENTVYIGEFRGIKGYCEPLIDEELFYRIKKYRTDRTFINQSDTGRVYMFAGLVKCKHCGCNMSSNCCRNIKKDGTKVEIHYYRCKKYITMRGCENNHYANESKIEKKLIEEFKKSLSDKIFEISKSNYDRKKNNVDVNKLKSRLVKLKDLYLDDLIDKESYKKEYNMITKQLEDAKKEKDKKKDVSKYEKLLKIDFEDFYNSLPPDKKKMFWQGVIDKIECDKDSNLKIFLL